MLMTPLKWSVATICLLSGCASFVPQPNMNVDQLKAIAADRSASVICSTIMGPWGTGKVVVVNMDQRVIDSGGVTVDANCLVGVTNVKSVPVPRAMVPAIPADPSKTP